VRCFSSHSLELTRFVHIGLFLSAGYIYPALLTALVPVRSYILARWFDDEDLKHLDPFGETEQDYHEEQKAFREAERKGASFDDDEDEVMISMDFPNRAMFRNGPDQQLYRRHVTAEHTACMNDIVILAETANDDEMTDLEMRIVEQEQPQAAAQIPPHEHDT
jgi:hypothetical protein